MGRRGGGAGGKLTEAPRRRKTAYRSGRREVIGIEGYLNARRGGENKTDRKVSLAGKRKLNHPLAFTAFRSKLRWKKL